MPKEPIQGVTPVGGRQNTQVPDESPVIVFTGAHMRCPCKPGALTEIDEFSSKGVVMCQFCGKEYDLPQVSYRWPPRSR